MMPVTWPPFVGDGLRQFAHHADRAAAIDQADTVLGEDLAEGAGGGDKSRVGARSGAAIDANFPDFVHFFDFVHAPACALRRRRRQGSEISRENGALCRAPG